MSVAEGTLLGPCGSQTRLENGYFPRCINGALVVTPFSIRLGRARGHLQQSGFAPTKLARAKRPLKSPAALIVDEASRVCDELQATISPMLAAAPAAQQFLLSTPAGAQASSTAPGPRAKTGSGCRSLPINVRAFPLRHLAAERIRLGDALFRQECFGAFVSAPGSVFDAEVLAHMFGDHTKDEPEEAVSILEGRTVESLLAMSSGSRVRRAT